MAGIYIMVFSPRRLFSMDLLFLIYHKDMPVASTLMSPPQTFLLSFRLIYSMFLEHLHLAFYRAPYMHTNMLNLPPSPPNLILF